MLGKTLKLMFNFEHVLNFFPFSFFILLLFFFLILYFSMEKKKSLPLTIFHRNAFLKWAHGYFNLVLMQFFKT